MVTSQSYLKRQSQSALVEKYRMLGESEAFLDTMEKVSQVARVNRPVLIIGERGTGKELVAARIHYLSQRWQQPRVTINCAAFSPELLESELFGHEQGAFTGAVRTKPGRFELANGGSIFLDELANSPPALQEKILRVLEYQEFERVGGTETIRVDVKIVAATNQDLPALCRREKFKEDLLDRLSFEVITLPPLRQRREDIEPLALAFARNMAHEMDFPGPPKFTKAALDSLLDYAWPGNIRELKNVVERAVFRSQGQRIEMIAFDPFESPFRPGAPQSAAPQPGAPQPGAPQPIGSSAESSAKGQPQPQARAVDPEPRASLPESLERLERRLVTAALEEAFYNQRKAATSLGISYYQLRRILKRLDLP